MITRHMRIHTNSSGRGQKPGSRNLRKLRGLKRSSGGPEPARSILDERKLEHELEDEDVSTSFGGDMETEEEDEFDDL